MAWLKKLRYILVANYFVAAALLGLAAVVKLKSHQVGDILQFMLAHDLLSFAQLIFILRTQPFFEIAVCLYALLGVGARYTSYFMGGLYIFFAGLVWYASEGYLFQPIDCGCFGEGEGTMAIILMVRNCCLGGMLFFVPKDLQRFTLFRILKKTAYSTAILPPIPCESCHLIHGKVATHSMAILPPQHVS